MKRKLSQKEKEEVVTKGFLEEYLDSRGYITKDYLDSKNYTTKEYVFDMFQTFQTNIEQSFRQHTSALMEFNRHENRLIIETLLSRIERIEKHVGLPSF